jgi:two-component system response regulator YesN
LRELGVLLARELEPVPADRFPFLAVPDDVRRERLLAKLSQRERSIIRDIAEYIERHYHEDITLQHFSDRHYLSREYISRRFKQELKENVSDYIARIRIGRARQLLRNPQLRIAQIAEIFGYRDEKYFSKMFKKMVGQSPNEYRKTQMPESAGPFKGV